MEVPTEFECFLKKKKKAKAIIKSLVASVSEYQTDKRFRFLLNFHPIKEKRSQWIVQHSSGATRFRRRLSYM